LRYKLKDTDPKTSIEMKQYSLFLLLLWMYCPTTTAQSYPEGMIAPNEYRPDLLSKTEKVYMVDQNQVLEDFRVKTVWQYDTTGKINSYHKQNDLLTNRAVYNSKSEIQSSCSQMEEQLIWKKVYNSSSRQLEEFAYYLENGDTVASEKIRYQWDCKGYLSRETGMDKRNKIAYYIQYKYTKDYKILSKKQYNIFPKGKRKLVAEVNYVYNTSNHLASKTTKNHLANSNPSITQIRFFYNENQVLKHSIRYLNEEEDNKVFYTYNDKGQLIQEQIGLDDPDEPAPRLIKYSYNKKGDLITVDDFMLGGAEWRSHTVYEYAYR
jgi:hypothetical protein